MRNVHMKKNVIYISLIISVITNIVILSILFNNDKASSTSERDENKTSISDIGRLQSSVESKMRQLVCENLYYPNSYDPVSTQIDSAFYNYLTDATCLKAAIELIDMRRDYESAKSTYDEESNNIRTFGSSGVFRHHRIYRDEAAARMKELKPKIEKRIDIIRNRNSSKDGEFIGWQVRHRYRACNSKGIVSFGNVLYVLDKHVNQYYCVFSLEDNDKHNLDNIRKTIEEILGIYVDE